MTGKGPRLLIVPLVAALFLIGGCGFLGGTNGNTPPGGIGNTNGIPAKTVNMTQTDLSPSAVTIRATQSVDFANVVAAPSGTSTVGTGSGAGSGSTPAAGSTPGGSQSNGGATMTVCIGQNGTCSSDKVGPSVLQWPPALVVPRGQSTAVRFDTPGTYHVTISGESGANLTVTVTQ